MSKSHIGIKQTDCWVNKRIAKAGSVDAKKYGRKKCDNEKKCIKCKRCVEASEDNSVTFDDEFVVHDIKVIEGDKGLFIAMPSKKSADGEYRDIAHPINSSTRENLQKVILESYEKALEEPEEAI